MQKPPKRLLRGLDVCVYDLCLADRTEELHLVLYSSLDSLIAGCKDLSGIVALALEILLSLEVLSGSFLECPLALGVYVDLGNAHGDGLLDLIIGDAGTAVENQRDIADSSGDVLKSLKGKTLPVVRILAVDVADACCEEVDAAVLELYALCRICTLAVCNYAVLFAADCAYLSLQGNAHTVSLVSQLSGLCKVLVKGQSRTVKHDRGEACIQTLVASLIVAVVKVKGNGNGDVLLLHNSLYHSGNYLVAAHVFACAHG